MPEVRSTLGGGIDGGSRRQPAFRFAQVAQFGRAVVSKTTGRRFEAFPAAQKRSGVVMVTLKDSRNGVCSFCFPVRLRGLTATRSVAQLAEQRTFNARVLGSIPSRSTRIIAHLGEHQIVSLEGRVRIPLCAQYSISRYPILTCSVIGNTADFGSVTQGSIPCGSTDKSNRSVS